MARKKNRTLSPESIHARENLEKWMKEELGVKNPQLHRKKIWKHLVRGTNNRHNTNYDINECHEIPKAVYQNFNKKFMCTDVAKTTSRVLEEKTSKTNDGAKLVVELQDGNIIETVIICHPHEKNKNSEEEKKENGSITNSQNGFKRVTVCVSSQVGCAMGCTFCATGTMGLMANLTAAEIVEQVVHAKERYPGVSNVVFMGMGEPLDNFNAVVEAILSMSDSSGLAIPLSRITLSTVGVTHGIKKVASECPEIQVALSLHAPTDEIREQIVPSNKAFSISKIMDAIKIYQYARVNKKDGSPRRVMIEYIMIDQINSTEKVAHELGALCEGKNFMVNLIPYNPTDAGDRYDFKSPKREDIMKFKNIVSQYKDNKGKYITCTVRWSSGRGQNIDAACGQLVLKNFKSTTNKMTSTKNGNASSSGVGDIEELGCSSTNKSNKKGTVKSTRKNRKKKEISDPPKINEPFYKKSTFKYVMAATFGFAVLSSIVLARTRKK